MTTLLAFVVGVGVGGGAVHWGTARTAASSSPASASVAEPPRVVQVARRDEPAEPTASWQTVAAPSPPAASAAKGEERAHASADAPARPASTGATDQLAAERSLLDAARAALARGDGSDALASVVKHEERYPNGALAEEREAMAIQALLLVKRFDDGRARGARFHIRFPRSVLMPAVDAYSTHWVV